MLTRQPGIQQTLRPPIRVGVSLDMPVYSPSLRRVVIQPGQAQPEKAWVPGSVPSRFTRPKMVTHLGTNRPSVE